MNLRIIAGSCNEKLSQDIAMHLGVELTKRIIKNFMDGESYVKIIQNVRGDDVFVIQSLGKPVNDSLMELLILIDALKRASAGRITAVIPYYAYARQDRKSEAREPISAKLVADLITKAGANRVLAIDFHVPQIQGFFEIPVDEVSAIPLFSKTISELNIKNLIVVAPDAGATKRARMLAKRLDCSIAIIDKRRTQHNNAEVMNIIGDVKNKNAILLDDIIDTGNSIIKASDAILKEANGVYICATHAVFSGECANNLMHSNAQKIIITNTLPVDVKKIDIKNDKFAVVNIGGFLSEVIRNIHNNKSVSELFD